MHSGLNNKKVSVFYRDFFIDIDAAYKFIVKLSGGDSSGIYGA